MKKKIVGIFIFLVIGIGIIGLWNKKQWIQSKEFNLQVDEKGNISWEINPSKATTGIRWRIQGFYLMLGKTELGYPLKDKDSRNFFYITFENDGKNVIVQKEGEKGGKIKFTNIIRGDKIKEEIIKNKKFYQALLKKIEEKKDYKLYLNTYFESYSVVVDSKIKKMVKNAFRNRKSPRNRGKFQGGVFIHQGQRYRYDNVSDVVQLLRKSDLNNIDKIKEAESWRVEVLNEWYNTNYYNHMIEYKVASNVLTTFVDEKQRLIGEKIEGEVEKKKEKIFYKETEEGSLVKKGFKKVIIKKEQVRNPRAEFRIFLKISDEEKKKEEKERILKEFSLSNQMKYVGDKGKVRFPKKIFKGRKKIQYEFIGCYLLENKTKKYLNAVLDGEDERVYEVILGLEIKKIYGEYRRKESEEKEKEDFIEGEGSVNPVGVIGAGSLERSEFNIEEGIPVTETFYKQVRTEKFILNYRFKKKTGIKTYTVHSKINWNLNWFEKINGEWTHKSGDEVQDYYSQIERKYSYWVIDKLEYYTIDGAYIENLALPDSLEKIEPIDYDVPKLEFRNSTSEEEHIKAPIEVNMIIDLGSKISYGEEVPEYDPHSEVNSLVSRIRVKNDFFMMDEKVIMNDDWKEENTEKPEKPTTIGEVCGEKVLYENGKKIDFNMLNGEYESFGKVIYILQESVNPENERMLEFEIEEVNKVVVHTPVVCDYVMKDAKEWCQLIEPNLDLYQLVITKPFKLDIFTKGVHLPIKGYGERDYERYVKRKEIIFPFDVIWNGKMVEDGTKIALMEEAEFILPLSVKEGVYEVKLRTLALNSDLQEERVEENANLSIENYVAETSFFVEVSGRLMDFSLENIKNTSIWDGVFSNGKYRNGVKLKNLPLIDGDHPEFFNVGDFRKGYAVEFAVTTIGNYYDELYGVGMEFDFYIVDENYKNRRVVDVYYEAISEEDGRYLGLIKIGSDLDRENKHFIYKNGKKIPLFTYGKHLFPRQLLVEGSDDSIQRWRGEYCLPARLHICGKGYPIEKYMKDNMALFLDEEFWIKKGKLIVNADITTMKEGKKVLSYKNKENGEKGCLNNWEYETGNREKYNKNQEKIQFQDGDIFVYDIGESIWQERESEIKIGY